MKNKYVLVRRWDVLVVGTIHDTVDRIPFDVLINVLWCVKGEFLPEWHPKERWFRNAEVTPPLVEL